MENHREFINLINTSFYLHEAADICVREMERWLNYYYKDKVNFKLKQKFNDIIKTTQHLEYLVEHFLDDYNKCYQDTEVGYKTENIRQIASYFARLALLIGDRCDDEGTDKQQLIYDFIETMPQKGAITDKTLNKLKL